MEGGPRLGDERYILLTTFRRTGTPVVTPVWAVGLDGASVGFMTGSQTGKAKRLAHTPRVTVQPCNARGAVRPGTAPMHATARLVTGEDMEAIRVRIRAKYRLETRVMGLVRTVLTLVGRPMPENDRGVVVSLPALEADRPASSG